MVKTAEAGNTGRKKLFIYLSVLLSAAAIFILILRPWGTKPFAKLRSEDIISAEFYLVPPGKTIQLTNRDSVSKLCSILNELVIYREDDSGREYMGQLVQATITLQDGTVRTVGAYGSFLFLDAKCYRTKYEPSEKMNSFGNRLLKSSDAE